MRALELVVMYIILFTAKFLTSILLLGLSCMHLLKQPVQQQETKEVRDAVHRVRWDCVLTPYHRRVGRS
jgi:cytochrome P450